MNLRVQHSHVMVNTLCTATSNKCKRKIPVRYNDKFWAI